MTQIGVGGEMTIGEFKASDGSGLSGSLLALWWDAKGDWVKAHEVAQDVAGADGAWFMLTCIARRGTWGMRVIGIDRRGGRLRVGIRGWSGRGLCGRCWGDNDPDGGCREAGFSTAPLTMRL
jgi:hypothetical protein